ncbi:MAG: hypothetical protein QOD98_3426, partial [Nocardioidaceae bacterium]|nr:hypothetical protein [Nocardioidaceae bacterium]
MRTRCAPRHRLPDGRRTSSWPGLGLLSALVLALVLPTGSASAYWSAGSAAGGSGASAATTVDRGATPTAVAAGAAVTVAWAASTLASGAPVTGYLVQRYDQATLTAQSVLASCDGRISATTCTEHGVPAGQWRYSVTPAIGTSWRGAESPLSSPVTSDTTPPVNAISLSNLGGNAFQAGDTVYYRGLAPGSFTLTNAVTDSGSGP